MAGEGIEYAWGLVKKLFRRLSMKCKRKYENFLKHIKECLMQSMSERVRQFSKRARKYMLAYLRIQQESSLPQATATHDRIKNLVDSCFKPDPEQLLNLDNDAKKSKRKRKMKKSVKIEEQDKEKLDAVLTYHRRGAKLDEDIVSTSNKRNRIAQAEETINLDAQIHTHRSHRSALDTDTFFINAEADNCELQALQ
jgi:hypothetical protein